MNSKDNIIKIFVVLIVLFFVFQTFYFTQEKEISAPNTPTNEGELVYVTARINATVVGYSDSIIISGEIENENLSLEISKFEEMGWILFSNKDEKELALFLSQEANISALAESLNTISGIKMSSKATLLIPDLVYVNTPQGKQNISFGKKISANIDPNIRLGEEVPLLLWAYIQDGQPVQYEVKLLPQNKIIFTELRIIGFTDKYIVQVSIPWESRNINKSEITEMLQTEWGSILFAPYFPNSSISIPNNISEEKAQKILNLSYVLSLNNGVIEINESFTNTQNISFELREILGEVNITFPKSTLSISFEAANFSKKPLTNIFPNSEIVMFRETIFEAKEKLTDETNKTYFILNRKATSYLNELFLINNLTLNSKIEAETSGNKITNIKIIDIFYLSQTFA